MLTENVVGVADGGVVEGAAADDEHLRVVDYVAGAHGFGEFAGDIGVGGVEAANPLEGGDGENVDVVVANGVGAEGGAAVDVAVCVSP